MKWWTYHPCDVCQALRHLEDLRSIGDGRVVCLDAHPHILPVGKYGRMPEIE